jgi:uncharacterized protein
MNKKNQRLNRLDALLHALPFDTMPMALSELDGYVTGLLACPEMIPPSDWLPHVWGETGDAQFPDQKTAEKTIGAVMEHYNSVASAITRSSWCDPIYEVDSNSDETLWEPWINGFTRAMQLRPDAWDAFEERADEEARVSMVFLMVLQDINLGESTLTEAEIDKIDIEAPDLIPNCVAAILTQSRPELSQTAAANLPSSPYAAPRKQSRNDPCACGSGRKYKLCCGRN